MSSVCTEAGTFGAAIVVVRNFQELEPIIVHSAALILRPEVPVMEIDELPTAPFIREADKSKKSGRRIGSDANRSESIELKLKVTIGTDQPELANEGLAERDSPPRLSKHSPLAKALYQTPESREELLSMIAILESHADELYQEGTLTTEEYKTLKPYCKGFPKWLNEYDAWLISNQGSPEGNLSVQTELDPFVVEQFQYLQKYFIAILSYH